MRRAAELIRFKIVIRLFADSGPAFSGGFAALRRMSFSERIA